jgi:hypothetical protein
MQPDHLPDYQMSLDDKNMVTFTNRYHVVKQSLSEQGTLPGLEDIPSLNPGKMFQRCWSAILSGCTRVRATFNPIE